MPFSDDFNGASANTNLSDWVPSGGGAWTLGAGLASCVYVGTDGALHCNSNTASYWTCPSQGTATNYIQAVFGETATTKGSGWVATHLLNASNLIGFRLSGPNTVQFGKFIGAAATGFGSTGVAVGDVIRLEATQVDATTISIVAYKNGAQVLTNTVTNSEVQNVTACGVRNSSNLPATAWITSFEAGTLAASGVILEGSTGATTAAAGDLSIDMPLTGAAIAQATATGAISTTLPLAGSASATVSASGTVTTQITLSGAALAQASATGATTITVALSGAAVAQMLAQANMTASSPGAAMLAGAAQAQASASGALLTRVPLAGSASATANASGGLGFIVALAGAAQAAVTSTGVVMVSVPISGAALAQAAGAGNLTMTVPLSGAALAQALAQASMFAQGDALLPVVRRWTLEALARRLSLAAPNRRLRIAANG